MPTVMANGIEIAYETFGSRDAQPLLMIIGLGSQMITWPDGFCRQLALRNHFVIRFDNRDSGLSSKFEAAGVFDIPAAMAAIDRGEPVRAPYTLSDMALDSIGLMDALNIRKAHVCGFSLGGMVAQTMAIEHGDRLESLIVMGSTSMEPDLPPGTPEARRAMFSPPPKNREGYAGHMVGVYRAFSGDSEKLDMAMVREMEMVTYDRAYYPVGFTRLFGAVLASGGRRKKLASVKVPTLVIHGTSDALVPLPHAEDIVPAVSDARLVTIDQWGHGLAFPDLWPAMVEAISAHTAHAAA